jgi:hypothetical protein
VLSLRSNAITVRILKLDAEIEEAGRFHFQFNQCKRFAPSFPTRSDSLGDLKSNPNNRMVKLKMISIGVITSDTIRLSIALPRPERGM